LLGIEFDHVFLHFHYAVLDDNDDDGFVGDIDFVEVMEILSYRVQRIHEEITRFRVHCHANKHLDHFFVLSSRRECQFWIVFRADNVVRGKG